MFFRLSPLYVRALCSSSNGNLWNESKFHAIADRTLNTLFDAADSIGDKTGEDVEVSLSQGVLNITYRPHGTWVINKQTTNQQIWWSSPKSGPQRYEYQINQNKWTNTRSGHDLYKIFQNELEAASGVSIEIDELESL